MLVLSLTALGSYGFMITHHTVGIDDTPYSYYFEEGLAAIVGRWVCFLLNKVVNIADFAPFLTDLAGVLILMIAVTVWCTLFHSILKDGVPWYGYLFFATIFISCPLISEVYVYYLHNAIAIGYLCSGVSLCFFREALVQRGEGSLGKVGASDKKNLGKSVAGMRKQIFLLLGSAVFLWIALGCYESFMMVWLLGVCLILATRRMYGVKDKVVRTIALAGVTALLSMVLRSVMIGLVTKVFGLEYLQQDAIRRSITELIGWMLKEDALSNFAMALKRTYVMYGVFACAYYPITIFILASAVIVITALVVAVKRKDFWIPVLVLAGYIAAFSLVVIEGKATYYRAAQFLPVICGYGALLSMYAVYSLWKKYQKKWAVCCKAAVVVILSCILWNQCADMNRWFYVDYQKYEAAKETMYKVAYELEKHFDTSKPIVFTGTYEIPSAIIQDAYVSYSDPAYGWMINMTHWLDEHLLEKFYRSQGVWVAQQPSLSVIDWGRNAFDTNQELFKFFEMHGITLRMLEGADYEQLELDSYSLPEFPKAGSIVDMGDYIVVHF